jgi:hypothetical protein
MGRCWGSDSPIGEMDVKGCDDGTVVVDSVVDVSTDAMAVVLPGRYRWVVCGGDDDTALTVVKLDGCRCVGAHAATKASVVVAANGHRNAKQTACTTESGSILCGGSQLMMCPNWIFGKDPN